MATEILEVHDSYRVEMLDPTELMKNEANWRTHPESQRKAVEQSLDENGYLQTALVNRRLSVDGGGLVLIDGHLRVEIARDRGEARIPCRVIEVPLWQERRILAVLDRTTAMAGTDDRLLLKLLEESAESDLGLPLAYDEDVLKELREKVLGDMGVPMPGEGGEGAGGDEFEPDPYGQAEGRCKTGDIWEIGRHMLYVGKWQDAVKEWPFKEADIIHADPPYGINLAATWSKSQKGNFARYKAVEGDDEDFDPASLLELGISQVVLWGANHFANLLPPSRFWFVWDKQGNSRGVDKHVDTSDCEIAWGNFQKAARIHCHVWDGFRRDSESGETRIHPTQKPVQIIQDLLSYTDGSTVFEPFAGSGSTLVACHRMGRTCYASELDEKYCDYILARMEAETGVEARKL